MPTEAAIPAKSKESLVRRMDTKTLAILIVALAIAAGVIVFFVARSLSS